MTGNMVLNLERIYQFTVDLHGCLAENWTENDRMFFHTFLFGSLSSNLVYRKMMLDL